MKNKITYIPRRIRCLDCYNIYIDNAMISTKKVDDFTKTKKYVSFISTRTCPLTCLSCKPGDGRSGLLTQDGRRASALDPGRQEGIGRRRSRFSCLATLKKSLMPSFLFQLKLFGLKKSRNKKETRSPCSNNTSSLAISSKYSPYICRRQKPFTC